MSESELDILMKRLEPFAKGLFSGQVCEWPQLKPLLADLYGYLEREKRRKEFDGTT